MTLAGHPFSPPARVLVVDDESQFCELIRGALEPRGYQVAEAHSGAEALASVAAAPPDVVLLDVLIPGIDGIEVCRRLKADPPTAMLPVIMVTAQSDRRNRLAGIDAGAADYLGKPIDLPDLALRVRNTVTAKRLADEVRENLSRLRDLEHLRDSLTHMIVHDLNSPLAAIIGSLELLQLYATAAAPKLDPAVLDRCLACALQMNDLIASLLDLSRLEAGKMPLHKEATELAPLVSGVLESSRSQLAGRPLVLSGPVGEATAFCDGGVVRRVLNNLIGNAIKCTPAGEVTVALSREASLIRVTVRDTGRGIAPEHHGVIFEKFRQVRESDARAGTGLGLAFCKLAVEAHGGRIGVESERGKGSTFWFTLPAG